MKILIAVLAYGAFFGIIELIAKRTKLSREVSRKVVHILAGISVAFLPFIISFREIFYLGLIFTPIMLLSKKSNILSSIHGVKRKTWGEVYFPVAIMVMALVFPVTYIFAYGLLIMAISDGFASLIGQKFGNHKYRIFSSKKSYEGSLAFLVCSVIIGVVILLVTGVQVLPALALSLVVGCVLTLAEGGLSGGVDNLILPPLAGGCLLVFVRVFGLG